jgi:antitoxin component YwqK of YwqJK toxin-antitoxin module
MGNIFSSLFNRKKEKKQNTARNGRWKEFNRFGIMIADGYYKNGLREGTWKIYSDSGNLVIEEEYVNGILEGTYKAFHENGNPISVGHYTQNKRDGEFRIFRDDGILNKILRFSNGELTEVTELYHPKKMLSA